MVPSQTTASGRGFTLVTGMGRRSTSRREIEAWHRRTVEAEIDLDTKIDIDTNIDIEASHG